MGFFGPKYGFWFVPNSKEYYPGGPLKQELMTHYDGILLNYLNGAHLGTGDFHIEPGWEKLYGPWSIYINQGDLDHKLQDVTQYSQAQQRLWPFDWVRDDRYPLERGTVHGKVMLDTGEKVKLKVVLSQGATTFDKSSGDYIYYANTDEQGAFTISNVRPGNYHLSAYVLEGSVTGIFTAEVVVKSGYQQLSDLTWKVPKERVLWQLGTSNHTTVPFQFSEELRNSIWRKLTPSHLVYEIGISQAEQDWYCIQRAGGTWEIHFNWSGVQQPLDLVIALAGASKQNADHENDRGHGDPSIEVGVNGNVQGQWTLLDDNAVYRNALKCGSYHSWRIRLAPEDLVKGTNVISFRVLNGYVMYDTVLLTSKL